MDTPSDVRFLFLKVKSPPLFVKRGEPKPERMERLSCDIDGTGA